MTRVLTASLLATAALALVSAAPPPRYTAAAPIPGADGGWDYASVGPEGTVYIARSTSVTVVDPAQPGTVRAIGTVAHGHGVVPIPDQKLLLVTSGADASVRLLDMGDGHEVARIAVGDDPDAAFYDPAHHRAAVMNAKGGTVSVIDVAAQKVIRTITLKPGLEFAQAGPGDTLFVNNEETNEIETADLATGAVGAPIALPGCDAPSGLAYDAASHTLISACANGRAAVVDAVARRQTGLLDIGMGPDAVLLDATRRVALVPCGKSGTLSVIALGDKPAVVATIPTAQGARTGTIDPRDGTVYLPTAQFGPPAKPGGRPTPLPGTFHLLVMKPQA